MKSRKNSVYKHSGGANKTKKSGTKLDKKIVGYNVTLIVKPTPINGTIKYTKSNMDKLKNWWETKLPDLAYSWPIVEPHVNVTKTETEYLLKLKFKVNHSDYDEVEMTVDNAIDPDDDGNYPIYINKNTKLLSLTKKENTKDYLLKGKIVSQKITNIY
jgi:hypothetical protein